MSSTAATPAKAPRARPYRDFLTPVLHQRFTSAFVLAIGVCYIESVLLGDWSDPLWSWFPLGFAGIRTLLLCVPLLAVFLLRVQRNHGMYQFNLKTHLTILMSNASWYTNNSLSSKNRRPTSARYKQHLARLLYLL